MKIRMTPQPHHTIPATLPPANCFTVLVIDDLLPNRVLLRKVLKSAGYAVAEAADGSEALAMLNSGSVTPDLVVTDIEMPVLDGIAFVESLRLLDGPLARIPVIAASGNADEAMREEALHAGADLFLAKPFDLSGLRRRIGALIKESRSAGERETAPLPPAESAPNRVALRLREAG